MLYSICLYFIRIGTMKKTKEFFDDWNSKKKYIEFEKENTLWVRVWEFRWYYEWINVWNEISKDWNNKRVCFVLKTDLGNWLVWIIPVTTKYHHRMKKWYIEIRNYKTFPWLKRCRCILNQMKYVDKRRLSNKVCVRRAKKWFVVFVIDTCISFLQK